MIQDVCIRKVAWSRHSCQPVNRPKSHRLLLLPCCTAIAGYRTSFKTSYSQWLATDKQEIHYWAWYESAKEWENYHNRIYLWQFKYVNAILIFLCMSNGLICVYITCNHDKRIVSSCTTWHLPQTTRVFDHYLGYYPPIILR